jgi:hypothetical protein
MTIDPNTGDLLLGTETVGPSSREREFLELAIAESAKLMRKTPILNRYQIWLPEVSGREFGIGLGFARDGWLEEATIKSVRSIVRAAGATGWSGEVEDEMKSFHDGWLRQQFGDPPYNFPWGRIVSYVEPHWYSAMISVLYRPKSLKVMT